MGMVTTISTTGMTTTGTTEKRTTRILIDGIPIFGTVGTPTQDRYHRLHLHPRTFA
jgi:outer membrane receptor for Fe3+-dicitrate